MTDVVVAGAGLAGLVCARELAANNLDVVVVEARDRVGGRTSSVRVGDGIFDFGGQWILPTQSRMLALATELGVELCPQHRDGASVELRRGKRKVSAGLRAKIPPLHSIELAHRVGQLERLAPEDAPDVSFAQWLDDTVRAQKAREALTMLTELTFAVEPADVSLAAFLQATAATGGVFRRDEFDDGVVALRCIGGAQQLCTRLASGLDIGCGERVDRIEQTGDAVVVHTDKRPIAARHAIVTLPPPLWSTIGLTAPHPDILLLGPIIKCVAAYPAAFWRDDGLSGEGYGIDTVVRAVVDVASSGQAALMAFIVGDAARTWSSRSGADRRAAVLADLERFFGERAGRPSHYAEHDWLADADSSGCVGVPGLRSQPGDWSRAREPRGRIHFASADTAAEWPGHMEGAVAAGRRAAREVLLYSA